MNVLIGLIWESVGGEWARRGFDMEVSERWDLILYWCGGVLLLNYGCLCNFQLSWM